MNIIAQCENGDCGCDENDMACKFAELKAKLEVSISSLNEIYCVDPIMYFSGA